MVHFASFSFARLFPLSVSRPVFLPTFPPNSWHSTHPYPSETTPLSFIILLFDAFSRAFCIKKLCKVPHLALLFHANSLVKCRISQVFCVKRRAKTAKWRLRCRHSSLDFAHQPHARMNYLRPIFKLRREKAARMLKFLLKIIQIEKEWDNHIKAFTLVCILLMRSA